MSILRAELRLIGRARLAVLVLALLFLLSALAVAAVMAQVARQQATIDRVAAEQARDIAAVTAEHGKPDGDPGYAAYYSFLLTSDPPPPLAFAAIGQRDVQPYVLRIRALGLQQQLYDAETLNAELALPGAFDWAFVLIYLAPLVVIALTHDLVAGEREGGRLQLLLSMPSEGLWRRRAGLRYALVLLALAVPFGVGAIATAAPVATALGPVAVAAVYVAFWFGLALSVAGRVRASATAAASLIGLWITLTLLLPTLANAAIARAVPTGKGIDLTLAQREIVHRGWDLPKEATFERFLQSNPEWRGREGFEGRFHWKWYYAMHQVGDEAVAADATAYRSSLALRESWTERLGRLVPPVAAQVLLHRLADTDLRAQDDYRQAIARFHDRLRRFFYPYLFADRPFTRADFARLPGFVVRSGSASWPAVPMIALIAAAGLALVAGARGLRRIG